MKLSEYLIYLNTVRNFQCIEVFESELVMNSRQTKQMKNEGKKMHQKGK